MSWGYFVKKKQGPLSCPGYQIFTVFAPILVRWSWLLIANVDNEERCYFVYTFYERV